LIVLRVCGATKERPRRQQIECWCAGLFCGRGGSIESKRFYAAFHTRKTAATEAQFSDLIRQADLFDGDRSGDQWREKLEIIQHRNTGKIRRRAPRAKSADVIPIASRRSEAQCRN
jgi:hypothetical protein